MFSGCIKLEEIVLGKKFAFNWNGTIVPPTVLPTPSSDKISGATGKWYRASDGAEFEPEDVHINAITTETYVAINPN